jgi:tetratricopeptide (TPR) repeat protein
LIAAHLQRREFDAALKAIAALEKKQPDNPLTYNLRGTALLGKRDIAGARKSFDKALALNAAYFPAAANLANLDLIEKKPEEARKRFEAVLVKDPKNVQAFLALAEMRAKSGGTTEEIAALIGKAVTANPTDPAPRLRLIGLYLSKNETKSALTAAQEALAVLPGTAGDPRCCRTRPAGCRRLQPGPGHLRQAGRTETGFAFALSAHGRN